jgi:RNA polymerase sigma-70 factor (ECF subfamily)
MPWPSGPAELLNPVRGSGRLPPWIEPPPVPMEPEIRHASFCRISGSDLREPAPWRVRLVRHLNFQPSRSHPLKSSNPGLMARVSDRPTTPQPPLLAAVARGDDGALERCFEVHGPLVWSIVRRRVKDHFSAEDLVQEIFTEIWKSAGRHDSKIASECGFIAMIARRRAIDWVRRQQRLPLLEPLPAGESVAAEGPPAGTGMDRESLWSVLAALPEETRRLFVLHFEKGMTHGEIAETTGLPLGSVKTRLRRGLIEARSLLQRGGGELNSELQNEP